MTNIFLFLLILNFDFPGKQLKSVSAEGKYEKIVNTCDLVIMEGNVSRVTLLCPRFGGDFDMNKLSSSATKQLTVECSSSLTSFLQPRMFLHLYNVQELTFKGCRFDKIPSAAFLGLRTLKKLTLATISHPDAPASATSAAAALSAAVAASPQPQRKRPLRPRPPLHWVRDSPHHPGRLLEQSGPTLLIVRPGKLK